MEIKRVRYFENVLQLVLLNNDEEKKSRGTKHYQFSGVASA